MNSLLFPALTNILHDKSWETFNRHVNSQEFGTISRFMILRYLTMSQSEDVRNAVLDNYITLERLDMKILYRWLMNNIPQQRSGFIKYIK